MRITIDEYAKRFKMSKEMIRAKLHAGRLEHDTVDGTIFIHIDDAAAAPQTPPPKTATRTTAGAIILMYQKENAALKEQIRTLEAKIDRLIGDKEQMLREERDRIESIYASRDEQLKAFLELINTKMLKESLAVSATSHPAKNTAESAEPVALADDPVSAAAAGKGPIHSKRIELQKYLATLAYSSEEIKQVKKRFAKAYGNDIRVLQENGKFILDFSKYDYSDLLAR